MNEELFELAEKIGTLLKSKCLKIATAESCTGGLLASVITAISGSSDYFDRGFITYSNEAKQEMLDVKSGTLEKYDAVSAETVAEMAVGALRNSKAQISVAISGIAGPTGGNKEKPVGTVYFCWASIFSSPSVKCKIFSGDRETIRIAAAKFSLEELITYLSL